MKHVILIGALIVYGTVYSQQPGRHCCAIIDMAKEAGTFTIRDAHTGKIAVFKPDALDGAELKVGDSVDVKFDERRIVSVKGNVKSYDLMDASNGDSCCVILKLDSAVNDSSWTVTAKNNSTGENIQFNVPRSLAARLSAGNIVYTQPTHGYAMIATSISDSARKDLYGFPLLQENTK